MSKLLKKILKTSLLPAALLIVSKLAGLLAAIAIFNLNVYLEGKTGNFFTTQLYFTSQNSSVLANSVSNLFMIVTFGAIVLNLLVRHTLSLASIHNPRTMVKLIKLDLMKWLTNSESAFIKVFVWSLFLWAACIVTLSSAINQNTYVWVGLVSIVTMALSIWGLIRTFEFETDRIYPKDKNFY